MKSLIGTKVGMTRIFDENGSIVPVTVIKIDKCRIVGLRNINKNGYSAIQLGVGLKKSNKITKPYKGLFKDINNGECPIFIREFRLKNDQKVEDYNLGQEFSVNIFEKGDYVDIAGISKGKGFAGSIKRHGFGGLPASHGHGEYRRAPGAMAASSFPSRVFKGKKLPGRFGGNRVTVQKLEIAVIKPEDNLLLVKGAVPGIRGTYLEVKQTVKALKKKKIVVKSANEEIKLNKKR